MQHCAGPSCPWQVVPSPYTGPDTLSSLPSWSSGLCTEWQLAGLTFHPLPHRVILSILRDSSAPRCFRCSFPLARLPQVLYSGCCMPAAALHGPATTPTGPSMDWWAVQAHTEKDNQTTKELGSSGDGLQQGTLLAWLISAHSAPYNVIWAMESQKVEDSPPVVDFLSLCLSNTTTASFHTPFFVFFRNCLVSPKEQLRDVLRDWLGTMRFRRLSC